MLKIHRMLISKFSQIPLGKLTSSHPQLALEKSLHGKGRGIKKVADMRGNEGRGETGNEERKGVEENDVQEAPIFPYPKLESVSLHKGLRIR